MAELSDYQLKLAAKEYYESCARQGDPMGASFVTNMNALQEIAPFLQLPWDEPREGEIKRLRDEYSVNADLICSEFVRRRNAALLPNPVDPRREAIVKVLKQYPDRAPEIADRILAALDEVK